MGPDPAALRSWDDKGTSGNRRLRQRIPADIYNANLADFLMNTVNKYSCPSRLHLEITESAYTEDPNQIIETVVSLAIWDLSSRWTTLAAGTPPEHA